MKVVLFLLLSNLRFFVVARLDASTIQLVKDYFSYKGVRIVRSFTCSVEDKISITKALQSTGRIWTILSDPEDSSFPTEDLLNWERSPFIADYYKFGVFLDYDCPSSKRSFNESSEKNFLNLRHQWLIRSVKGYLEIEHGRLNIDSEVTWATLSDPTSGQINLFDLYKINYTWPLIATPVGHWNASGLHYNITKYKYIRRENLQHLMFDMAIATFNPKNGVEDVHAHLIMENEKNFTTIMSKCSYAQTLMLQKKFNFTTQLHMTDSSNFAPFDDGFFNGHIGMLQKNQATFSPCPLLVFVAREKVIDFVAPTWYFDVAAMFRHPPVRGMGNAFLEPFSFAVWMCTLTSWIMAFITLKFAAWAESSLQEESEIDSSWSGTVLATVGAISEQGSEMESQSVSWRIMFLFILLQVVILNNYYGGGIISSLLAEPEKTIKTLQDLINSPLAMGYEDVNYNRGYFKESNDPLIHILYTKKIFPQKQQAPNEYRIDIGVKKMKDEPFIFHGEQIGAYPFIDATFTDVEKCALTEIRIFPSMVGPVYTMVQKGSPYKEIFVYGYRQIWERGLMRYQLLKWQPAKPRCLVVTEVLSVELGTILFAYHILFGGLLIATTLMLIEMMYFKRCCLKLSIKKIKKKPRNNPDLPENGSSVKTPRQFLI
ncbi:Ionotropic receptor 75y [Blattella germanica]|nr:Ionotropic receptor 75y [Blattella germanica]